MGVGDVAGWLTVSPCEILLLSFPPSFLFFFASLAVILSVNTISGPEVVCTGVSPRRDNFVTAFLFVQFVGNFISARIREIRRSHAMTCFRLAKFEAVRIEKVAPRRRGRGCGDFNNLSWKGGACKPESERRTLRESGMEGIKSWRATLHP